MPATASTAAAVVSKDVDRFNPTDRPSRVIVKPVNGAWRWPSSSTPSTVGEVVLVLLSVWLTCRWTIRGSVTEGPTSVQGPQTGEVLPVVDIEPR